MVTSLLRSVFIWLDSLIYSLVGTSYELLMDIARINILSNDTVNAFADRVYALLAIFMLFRLSFSILTYIINPDNSTDKSAGAGKLIGNVLITLVMLISAPWIFTQVRNLQSDLLEENIVGKIILGTTSENNKNGDGTFKDEYISNQLDPGDIMAWTTFEAFFQPVNENALENYNVESDSDEELSAATAWKRVKKSQSVKAVNKFGLTNLSDDYGDYVFDYLPLISTIAGGFIAYILILFCFQIAVRSVKLSALQLIAPIPIISYIDPKHGKDGMFKKWYKLCIKTFADLFIRLAAIYFAVFIIGELTSNWGSGDLANVNVFVKVIIIIGALMFAKELPKFIEEITGVKLSGGFSLNPFKNNALLGGFVGGAVGAGLGAVGGFAGNIVAGNGVKSAFRGGMKGFASGGIGGIKDKGLKKDTFTRGSKAGVATGTNYANWAVTGSTMRGRMASKASSTLGAKTPLQKLDDEIKAYESFVKEADALFSRSNSEMIKHDYNFADTNGNNISMAQFKAEKERLNILRNKKIEVQRNAGESDAQYNARVAQAEANHASEVSRLNDYINKTEKKAEQAYVNEVRAGNITDGNITSTVEKMEQILKENSNYEGFDGVSVSNGANIKAAKDSLSTKKTEVQNSGKYTAAQANQQAVREAKANK